VSLVYRAGAFFFYFGIASAIFSGLFIAVFLGLSASSGVPIPDLVYSYARLFAFSALVSALISLVSAKVVSAVFPSLSQAISVTFLLTNFLPVYTPTATAVTQTIMLLPLRPEVTAGLATFMHGFIAFTLIYYILVKAGFLPVM
jgi:hypothetical protein